MGFPLAPAFIILAYPHLLHIFPVIMIISLGSPLNCPNLGCHYNLDPCPMASTHAGNPLYAYTYHTGQFISPHILAISATPSLDTLTQIAKA